ncbi:GNAT family N-acetyltransferase [Marinobacter sp. C2H3]|uniref:GNAT family N-acetyltransferase n=1 Tax=Marinobacter sp. C2H3 TaxID=3119003 RepID=UPI00300F4EE6
MTLRIRRYSWQLAPAAVREIRQRVFIDEQRVPPELEWDNTDDIADHYLAVLPDNTPVAVARVFPALDETGHIGRMAVLPEHRGRGAGLAMLQHLIRETAPHYGELRLSAQEHAIRFYQSCGFHVCSDVYDDAGIPHVDMRCLAPARISEALDTRTRPALLGEDDAPWLFDAEDDGLALLDNLVGQARQRLWLYDRWLGHEAYDRGRFRDLLSTLARRHRQSEVRLLIHDDKPLVKRRHQLVELMRRLPSHISLRLVNTDLPSEDQPFALVDRDGLYYRHGFDRPDGFANFHHPGRVKVLAESFQRMWDSARPSVELRELPI